MFSELQNICAETGLSFSDEHTALYGSVGEFGATVADNESGYEVRLFCERPFEREQKIFPVVSAVGEGLPKNTILSVSCEFGYIRIVLDKYSLMQEDIVFLVEFLDKLSRELQGLELTGKMYELPRKPKTAVQTLAKDEVRIKLGFDMRSVLGLLGAVIGAAAMTVIAIMLVDVKTEANVFGLAFEVSTYPLSAAAAAVIFADYRFIARKLDACGIIVCPVLTLLSVITAGFGAGVKTCAAYIGISFMSAVSELPAFFASGDAGAETERFVAGYITRGVIVAVIASIAICTFYFSRHPEETIRSDKVIKLESRNK